MISRRPMYRYGFTIVELLIVIVVIAILAVIGFVAYNGISNRAIESSMLSDLDNASKQLATENITSGSYPYTASAANNGDGLRPSGDNTFTYVLKPYGYCLQVDNARVEDSMAIKSNDGQKGIGICNAVVSTFSGTGVSGYADGPAGSAQFSTGSLAGLVFDAAGDLYVGDGFSSNYHIRKVASDGTVATVGSFSDGGYAGYAPKPGAIDAVGNIYFTPPHSNPSYRYRVWRVTPGGVLSVFAGASTGAHIDGTLATARFEVPAGVVSDASGNLYIADNIYIRKITPGGVVSTLAGSTSGYADGTGASAQFTWTAAIAIDKAGNLYVGDQSILRKVTPDGVVTTIAGTPGVWGYQDGPAASAQFQDITSVAVDQAGIVYIADNGTGRIRKLTPDGTVSTLTGNGVYALVDGLDTDAQFGYDLALTVDAEGNLYTFDSASDRVRKITQ